MSLPLVDTRVGFFQFISPTNKEELEAFRSKLKSYAYAAHDTPLRPLQRLVVTSQRSPRAGYTFTDGKRKLPPMIPFVSSTPLDSLQLVLTRPLQTGERKWSQVWQGTMASKSRPESTPFPVAIKIFQESFFKYLPNLKDFTGQLEYADWFPGAHLAASEAWAYDQMQDLQGRTVPWSYGFYKFILPNGEAVFGHVMEFIDGFMASTQGGDDLGLSNEEIFVLADTIAMAIHEIHSCGVSHTDLKEDNVIILRDRFRAYIGVVIIDFAFCAPLSNPPLRDAYMQGDAEGVWTVIRKMGIPKPIFVSWNDSRKGMNLPWRKMFVPLDDCGWLTI